MTFYLIKHNHSKWIGYLGEAGAFRLVLDEYHPRVTTLCCGEPFLRSARCQRCRKLPAVDFRVVEPEMFYLRRSELEEGLTKALAHMGVDLLQAVLLYSDVEAILAAHDARSPGPKDVLDGLVAETLIPSKWGEYRRRWEASYLDSL